MNKRDWLKRAFCVALVVLLLFAFCAVGHKCHHDHCPVCLLAASFRLSWGLLALAVGLSFLLLVFRLPEKPQPCATQREGTPVALKVKLSD